MLVSVPNPYAIPGIKAQKPVSPLTLPVQAVITRAATFFNCSTAEIKKKCRQREVIDRRILVCHYLRNRGYTFNTIAKCLNQDHTTIIHATNSAANLISLYPAYQKSYADLCIFLDA